MGGGKRRVSGDRRSTLQFQGNHPPKPQGKMIMGGWWQNIMMHSVGGLRNGAALPNLNPAARPQWVDSA